MKAGQAASESWLFSARPTIRDVLDRNRGLGPGFDFLRVGLSLAILLFHCFAVSYGPDHGLWDGYWRPLLVAMVPAFFALSGFLVTGSAVRTLSIRVFMGFRALRIVPALFTEVVLSALVLGPCLTVLPLAAYFSDPKFLEYFGNIAGLVKLRLPGVFLDNPMPEIVNINLWTLPAEFYCYLIMGALMVSRIVTRRSIVTALFAVTTIGLVALNITKGWWEHPRNVPGNVLIFYFLVGSLMFQWRDRLPVDFRLFCASAVAAYLLICLKGTVFIAPFPIAYCIIYLGMLKLPTLGITDKGDYSYGVYLYGYPIQQAVAHLFPSTRVWWVLFLIAAPLTMAFAVFSWHAIEKPALAFKRRLAPRRASPPERLEAAEPDPVLKAA